jgi:Na+/H+-dicarboxylate symporter
LGTARAFATADRFFSEIRAVTNLFSNIFAIVVVAR